MPRADGYVMGSLGTDVILPPMPPGAHRTDIARKDNAFKNNAIKSCFWPGPKLRTGYYTTDPDDYGLENQIPDIGNTFSTAWFKIPAGAKIVMKGDFPHMRHWSFVTYTEDGVPRDGLHDIEIEPDAGSSNPFRAGVRRDVEPRRYTITIVNGAPPEPSSRVRPTPSTRWPSPARRSACTCATTCPTAASTGPAASACPRSSCTRRRQGAGRGRKPAPPPTRRGAASRCR